MPKTSGRCGSRHSTVDAILHNLETLAAHDDWQALDLNGKYYLDYHGAFPPWIKAAANRRLPILQALLFYRSGQLEPSRLDTEIGQELGLPVMASIQISAAALGIACGREDAPDHLRGKLKTALGL